MSDDTSITAAPERKMLVAKHKAFIKSEKIDARELSDDKRLEVAAGAQLLVLKTGMEGRQMSIAEAELNGEALPPHLTYINRDHWRVVKPGEDPTKPPGKKAGRKGAGKGGKGKKSGHKMGNKVETPET